MSVVLCLTLIVSSFQASSPDLNVKTSTIIEDNNMFLSFSSSRPFYDTGQKASFFIDVVNRQDQVIRRIDYTLSVKYLGIEVFRMEESSEREGRGYRPGVWERLSMEKSLPELIPPGLYALEFFARPVGMDATGPATIVIYVRPSPSLLQSSVFAVIVSGVLLTLSLTAGAPLMRRIDEETIRLITNFSIGQKFAFSGICLLMLAAFMLMGGLEMFANEFATLTYFSLVIGVLNLFWDSISESRPRLLRTFPRTPFSSRTLISLLAFGILIYLSRPAISNPSATFYILILSLILVYTIMREAKKRPQGTKTWIANLQQRQGK